MSLPNLHDDVVDAAVRLPGGVTLIVSDVTWDDYERLLAELFERRRHLRISYDRGSLEIMSPLPEHEEYARFIDALVRAFCDSQKMELENRGQATWKRRALGRGVEPDSCYYTRNAERIIGKREIDLSSDPPPDIVVEIDLTNDSSKKFSIYASLGVPEIWTYDRRIVKFHNLHRGKYTESPSSRFLPGLTPRILAEAIEISKTHGQRRALELFRRKIGPVKSR
jgi:Uma2 family endonuclease